jgi:CDP-diacylglycerol---glycerol-3-phosphate 3-phosphatidyltransferase
LPIVIDMRVRPRVQGILQPIGKFLARVGISPTFMTLFGFVVAVAGSILIGLEQTLVGAWVFLVGSALDGLDGAVARASNRVSARGGFLDATVDRLGEIAMLTGLAVAQRGDARILLLSLLSMGAALMIPYLRAKAEVEGLDGKGGLMGRAERVLLFSIGLMIGQIEPMLWLMLIGNWYTVGQRFWSTYRSIDT